MSQYDRFEGCANDRSACAPMFLIGCVGWAIITLAAYALGGLR